MSHASHVLIRGHVFTYKEKAPFVASGVSVLGALEYDKERDELRCHECGCWFDSLTTHLKKHHVGVEQYKLKHGLNVRTGLVSLKNRKARAAVAMRTVATVGTPMTRGDLRFSVAATATARREACAARPNKRWAERNNNIGRCGAQLLFRIQLRAAEIGHTPTTYELAEAGMPLSSIIAEFGSHNQAIAAAGLVENIRGHSPKRPLPAGFPSKEILMESRMPWPKEYFGTREPSTGSGLAGL